MSSYQLSLRLQSASVFVIFALSSVSAFLTSLLLFTILG